MLERTAIGTDGFELRYQDVGEGPPITFVHGFGGNHLSWWQQVATFSDSYRCIVPDQRRFGRSTDTEGRGVAAFADDIVALLEHLGIERTALVGQSMGGWTVGSVASQHPDRVAALVLSATPGGLIEPDRHYELMAEADDPPDVDPLTPELDFLGDAISALNHDSPEEWEETRAILDDLPLDPEAIVEAGVPTHVITGEADEFMPAPAVEAVAADLDAESAIVEGAGHSVYFEQPETFNRVLGDFLDERARY